jgi:hypothetical protein
MQQNSNSSRLPVKIDGIVTVVNKADKVASIEVGGLPRVVDPSKTQVFKDVNGTVISTLYFDANGDFAGEA